MARYWMHWSVSKDLYKCVRPTVIILRDLKILDFAVSECYDKIDLGICTENIYHQRIQDLLNSLEEGIIGIEDRVSKEKDEVRGSVGEFLGLCEKLDVNKISLVRRKSNGDGTSTVTLANWEFEDMYGWSAEQDRLISGLKMKGFDVADKRLTIYAEG